jgi:hypothetical protein
VRLLTQVISFVMPGPIYGGQVRELSDKQVILAVPNTGVEPEVRLFDFYWIVVNLQSAGKTESLIEMPFPLACTLQ